MPTLPTHPKLILFLQNSSLSTRVAQILFTSTKNTRVTERAAKIVLRIQLWRIWLKNTTILRLSYLQPTHKLDWCFFP